MDRNALVKGKEKPEKSNWRCVMGRDNLMKKSVLIAAITAIASVCAVPAFAQAVPTLDPLSIPKYVDPMVIPPAMPKTGLSRTDTGQFADYYEIGFRQFNQQVLPTGLPMTTVWGYGSIKYPATFNYPAFTIEAKVNKTVKVKWVNELVDVNGNFIPYSLPVDQTIHWANPPAGNAGRDFHGTDPAPYVGPVPMTVHVHGAHVKPEHDGHPLSWYLPAANDIPAGYATTGTHYDLNKQLSGYGAEWGPGFAIFDYPNDQRAATLWYHDHGFGITRVNVYMGSAGFYHLRGGPGDVVMTSAGRKAVLPYPAPNVNTKPGDRIYEIPIAIQDRSFNADGSLFFPDSRAFFDGFTGPYAPVTDIAPIHNPEFFGNTIVVNGKTWPYLQVEQRRYRFRLLNGCEARTVILQMDNALPFWQIGAEQGFLAAPVSLSQLLIGPAERSDVIVDFTTVPVGTNIILQNVGYDAPFNGTNIPADLANPLTTGQVMQFQVIARKGLDISTPPAQLVLPAITPKDVVTSTRQLSINELDSVVLPGIGPSVAFLGTTSFLPDGTPVGVPLMYSDIISETPLSGTTEMWEIYNFTVDAHPVHLHLVDFEVVNREVFDPLFGTVGTITPPEAWESGTKDTAVSYPGEILRVKAKYDKPGQFVWHCHIIDHEDNEMMRPYTVVPGPQDLPAAPTALRVSRAYTTAFLIWTDNSNNEKSFQVERGLAAIGPFTPVATVKAGTRFYTDKGLIKGTNYFYRVSAINNFGSSAYTNTAP
ncbi:MAG: hypothetical protein A2X45_05955 [Lentisphaerae bacterium GWF2_50_93]|nr:MAG: hypothetical protein A2X45_05955 [Lentisphaerae bacterium GWF2_50_93]